MVFDLKLSSTKQYVDCRGIYIHTYIHVIINYIVFL